MKYLIIILALLVATPVFAGEKYAARIVAGEIAGYQKVTDEYLKKFSSDPSNPVNNGYTVISDLKEYPMAKPPVQETEKEHILKTLGITEAQLAKVANG
jgi:hypothetical protein